MINFVTEKLGKNFGPEGGAARVYAPGFGPLVTLEDHPLIKPVKRRLATALDDPGSSRRLLLQRICELSVQNSGRAAGS